MHALGVVAEGAAWGGGRGCASRGGVGALGRFGLAGAWGRVTLFGLAGARGRVTLFCLAGARGRVRVRVRV